MPVSIFRRGVFAVLLVMSSATGSLAAPSWDGTWVGGWEAGDGIQIIIAGDNVIGVGRGDVYRDVLSSQASPEGRMFSFSWVGGDGFLQRTGDRDATLVLRERGRAERRFVVHRE
jgi:hypothetical protein